MKHINLRLTCVVLLFSVTTLKAGREDIEVARDNTHHARTTPTIMTQEVGHELNEIDPQLAAEPADEPTGQTQNSHLQAPQQQQQFERHSGEIDLTPDDPLLPKEAFKKLIGEIKVYLDTVKSQTGKKPKVVIFHAPFQRKRDMGYQLARHLRAMGFPAISAFHDCRYQNYYNVFEEYLNPDTLARDPDRYILLVCSGRMQRLANEKRASSVDAHYVKKQIRYFGDLWDEGYRDRLMLGSLQEGLVPSALIAGAIPKEANSRCHALYLKETGRAFSVPSVPYASMLSGFSLELLGRDNFQHIASLAPYISNRQTAIQPVTPKHATPLAELMSRVPQKMRTLISLDDATDKKLRTSFEELKTAQETYVDKLYQCCCPEKYQKDFREILEQTQKLSLVTRLVSNVCKTRMKN